MRKVSADQFYAVAGDASKRIQLGLTGWAAIIPSAADFFLPDLTCSSLYRDPASSDNLAGFCDPHVDELAGQARAVRQTDPGAARKQWAGIDRIVTDQAPWIPVFNQSWTVFVSARVGNYQESPYYAGPLLDQIWIQ